MRPTVEWQRGLQFFNGHFFVPDGASSAGAGLGAAWTTGGVGTLSHATPGTAFDTQLKRTIWTEAGASNNQELGIRQSLASEFQYWFGNGTDLGGWYMSAMFRIEAWNNDAARLFVGMSATNTPVCISDTVVNNTIGLWHDTGDAQDVLSLVTKAAGATTKLQLTANSGAVAPAVNAPGILAAGSTLLFELWAFPNAIGTVNTNCRLSQADTTNNRFTKIVWNAQGGGPSTTSMCAPQCQMSNGTDATAGHFAIGIANIYVAPYSGEYD